MKRIPLTQGQFALIDNEDYALISAYVWRARYNRSTNSYYAVASKDNGVLFMHRLIAGTLLNLKTDHKNHNTLDNRKDNLRHCTDLESACNRGKRSNNKTGYKGVYLDKESGLFRAILGYNNAKIHLGRFDTAEKASAVYEAKARELHKEFYYKNFKTV